VEPDALLMINKQCKIVEMIQTRTAFSIILPWKLTVRCFFQNMDRNTCLSYKCVCSCMMNLAIWHRL